MERKAHHSVGEIERLLDAISVVDVDVDVEHTRVHFEELLDGEDDVVDVAEAGGGVAMRVMQTAWWTNVEQ